MDNMSLKSYNLINERQGPKGDGRLRNISGADLKCGTVQQRFMRFAELMRF